MTPDKFAPFPRVTLPDVDQEMAAYVATLTEHAREERAAATRFAIKRLQSLARKGKHIYAHTVPAAVVAKRRARGKVAKASRKANR